MQLAQAKRGHEYIIEDSDVDGRARARLDSLGLVTGETVRVFQSSYAGLILEIKGSRLAVCKSVARELSVREA